MFARPNSTHTGHDVERRSHRVALVGPAALCHQNLVERAGYQVFAAKDGIEAADLFGKETLDVVVLDFELKGRPPEAILLFSHRTSPDAVMVALVPAEIDAFYRRAFLVGARDVLPSPARGEDLLGSIDFVLEPRVLSELVNDLRGGGGTDYDDNDDDEGTMPHIRGTQLDLLRNELSRTRNQFEQETSRLSTELAQFRQQALDVVLDRDRIKESRDRARRRLTQAKAELRDRKGQLAITEQACEALQNKLKELRDRERKVISGEVSLNAQDEAELTQMTLNPVLAAELRNADAERSAAVEETQERLKEARAAIGVLEERTRTDIAIPEDEKEKEKLEALSEALRREVASLEVAQREIDQQRIHIAALENTRISLEERVAILERDRERAVADLEMYKSISSINEEEAVEKDVENKENASAQLLKAKSKNAIDTARQPMPKDTEEDAKEKEKEKDSLMQRLFEKERELADLWTQLDELLPLKTDIEALRSQLHSERGAHLATKRSLEHDKSQMKAELDEMKALHENTLGQLALFENERQKMHDRLALLKDS